jgi:ribonuclease R
MRAHLGEDYSGVVSAATSFGIFVTLDAMYVEGLVHITELGGEYFKFDEARQELRGERTGIRYAIGTRVRVQVSRVDLDGRKIDFRLVRENEELIGRALKDKGVGGDSATAPGGKKGRSAAERKGSAVGSTGKGRRSAADASALDSTPSARDRGNRSPVQSLQASVKQAVASGKAAKGKGRKARRS